MDYKSATSDKIRSMQVYRELKKQYGLIPATEKQHRENNLIFKPVDSSIARIL
ncbi:TPA: hypothetical protein ACG0AO_003399 [Elizabethkingia meningoseptica]